MCAGGEVLACIYNMSYGNPQKVKPLQIKRANGGKDELQPVATAKVAGIFINTRNVDTFQIKAAKKRAEDLRDTVRNVPLRLSQDSADLLINGKVRPSLAYKLRTTAISPSIVQQMDTMIMQTLKLRAGWKKTVAVTAFDITVVNSSLTNVLIADRLKTWLSAVMTTKCKKDQATTTSRNIFYDSCKYLTGGPAARSGKFSRKQAKHCVVANTMAMVNTLTDEGKFLVIGAPKEYLTIEADDTPLSWILEPWMVSRDQHRHEVNTWTDKIVSTDGQNLNLQCQWA